MARLTARGSLLALALLLSAPGCATVRDGSLAGPAVGVDRFARARGYTVHYVEAGAGRPIVLVPGAFTTYRAWSRLVPDLALHGRVLAVDYVGMGESDKPEQGFGYTVEEQADVLAGLIEQVGAARATVVGASYGGAIALNLAARYPALVDRVVCIEGGGLIRPEVLNYSSLGALVEWPVLGDIIWAFMHSGLFDRQTARSVMGPAWHDLSALERDEVTAVMASNIQGVSRASWAGIYRAITAPIDFRAALEAAPVRGLYLYGEASRYRAMAEMNADWLLHHMPGIEVIRVPGGIHDLHLQYPHDVSRLIVRVLAAQPIGPALARTPFVEVAP